VLSKHAEAPAFQIELPKILRFILGQNEFLI